MKKQSFLFILLAFFLAISLIQIRNDNFVFASGEYFFDDFEANNMNKWNTTVISMSTESTNVKNGNYSSWNTANYAYASVSWSNPLPYGVSATFWINESQSNGDARFYLRNNGTVLGDNRIAVLSFGGNNGYISYVDYNGNFVNICGFTTNAWYYLKMVRNSAISTDFYIYNQTMNLVGSALGINVWYYTGIYLGNYQVMIFGAIVGGKGIFDDVSINSPLTYITKNGLMSINQSINFVRQENFSRYGKENLAISQSIKRTFSFPKFGKIIEQFTLGSDSGKFYMLGGGGITAINFPISADFVVLILMVIGCIFLCVVKIPLVAFIIAPFTISFSAYATTDVNMPFYPNPIFCIFGAIIGVICFLINANFVYETGQKKFKRGKR